MSLISEKRVLFIKIVSSLEKGSLLGIFTGKKGYFLVLQVSILRKKGSFFPQKISVKGVIFFI